jgi:hypothetical protein
MKPNIRAMNYNGARKWYCESYESGVNGVYQMIGGGYTPKEAYDKWFKQIAQQIWQADGKRKGPAPVWFIRQISTPLRSTHHHPA